MFSNILYFIVPEKYKDEALSKIKNSNFNKNIGLYTINKNNEIILVKKERSNKKVFDYKYIKELIITTGYNKYIYS